MAGTNTFLKASETTASVFKKIFSKLRGGTVDEFITATVSVDGDGNEIDFAKNATLTDGSQKTEVTASALPTGAATEATLVQIRDAIKNQINIASSIWTDDSGDYYIRTIESDEGTETIVYTLPDGTTATPGAGLRPLASADRDIIQEVYDAVATGTGFTAGDILSRAVIYNADKNTATPIWLNLTQGTVLSSAPSGSDVERANEKITVSSAGGALALDTTVAATNTSLGTDGATPPTIAGTGVRGWLRGIYEQIIARLPAALVNGALSTNLTSYTFTSSTLNSSTTQISAGGNFPGAVETAFNQPAVQVMVIADQPIRVVLEQYIDAAGTKLVRSSSFTRLASEQLNENIQINANFFRVRVFNLGASVTTTFELNTTYGPLPPLPTELTNQGALKVQQQKKITYAVTTLAFTPAATATDLITITSAANKTIKIHSIKCNGTATAATNIDLLLIKRSAQNTGGTFVAETKVPLNASSSASTAVINRYSVNPTALGAAVGTITRRKVYLPLAATVIEPINELIEQDTDDSDFITLTGATEMLAINFNGAAVPAGASIYFTIKYTEES